MTDYSQREINQVLNPWKQRTANTSRGYQGMLTIGKLPHTQKGKPADLKQYSNKCKGYVPGRIFKDLSLCKFSN